MRHARVVRIREPGGPEVLELAEEKVRPPGIGELLVRVEAAGLNRADLLQRRGLYPAPAGSPRDIPGLEYAGTVEAVGEGELTFQVGDRMMGIVGGGAMASFLNVPSREAIPIPEGMGMEEAASLPEAFLTAFDALSIQGDLRMGQHVLIHAVGSGVGTAALQLALAMGAIPLGTSRTREKLDRCQALGLEHGILAQEGAFAQEVLERTGGKGADRILDLVGGSYLGENLRAVASRGVILAVGLLGGGKGEVPLSMFLQKRATLIGTVLRSRPPEEKAALAQRFAREVVPLFEKGTLRGIVDATFPMEDVAEAHRYLESNRSFGKVVVTIS